MVAIEQVEDGPASRVVPQKQPQGVVASGARGEAVNASENEIPEWSGVFYEFEGEGRGMMRVSIMDEEQHFPPAGWEPVHHSVSEDGDFEVYTFRAIDRE